MRSSARIPSLLAGLALAAGGVVIAAPAAHADIQACEQHVTQKNKQVTDVVRQACYQGQIGNQTSCTASLDQAGISKNDATEACRAAPK
ncbi:hypothetical protein ACWGCI_04915 [Streptomyces sp. NPDC054949]|uniref:hypothetical protein n=1 Tax=unclassified Streptomyces TaxID=2593676 RepID=UPI00224EE9C8|nr:hypothetical protein [Streptomyces sp. NBC_00424]MCX5071268.1 hypothetical protein [Streptomyces sp. NBC_00424]WUD45316.1 hypothetical protein OHA84_35015 [Streptomyces sp. NBC_00513]